MSRILTAFVFFVGSAGFAAMNSGITVGFCVLTEPHLRGTLSVSGFKFAHQIQPIA